MNKIYNDNLLNIAHQIIDNEQLFDLLILDLNNIEYNEDYEKYKQKIKDILAISSYLIKNGSNIIVICSDYIKDTDMDILLSQELLWTKNRTIICKSKFRKNNLLASEYNYIFWYSNNYRPDDPTPICNNFHNGQELSDLWGDNINIYKRIIEMFSNENDNIIEPFINNEDISNYCKELNRNYIGVKNKENEF